jgi:putative ABC transport system permease protein
MTFSREFPEYFAMAWQAIKANALRSILTTLGIVIGITTIIAIFAIIDAMDDYVHENLSIISASTVYVQKFPWVITDDFWRYRNRPEITDRDMNYIKKHSKFADYVAPFVTTQRNVKYMSTTLESLALLGTNENYMYTTGDAIELGRFLQPGDVSSRQRVVILGWDVAEQLFKNPAIAIGKEVKIGGMPFKVVGVQEKRGEVFGRSADDFAFIPITTLRSYFGSFRNLEIAIKTIDVADIENLTDELQGLMRTARRLEPKEADNFSINRQDQLTDFYNQITGPLYLIVIIIGGVSLLVGGIGIMNIMLVSVTERTREIGIRKAIGAKKSNILIQFITEAVLISLFGGVIGYGLGILLSTLATQAMSLEISVTFSTIFLGILFSSLVGIASGFYPALKAARKNPIDALRFE